MSTDSQSGAGAVAIGDRRGSLELRLCLSTHNQTGEDRACRMIAGEVALDAQIFVSADSQSDRRKTSSWPNGSGIRENCACGLTILVGESRVPRAIRHCIVGL